MILCYFLSLSIRKTKKVSPTDLNAPNAMRNAFAFAELTIKEDSGKPLSFLNIKESIDSLFIAQVYLF